MSPRPAVRCPRPLLFLIAALLVTVSATAGDDAATVLPRVQAILVPRHRCVLSAQVTSSVTVAHKEMGETFGKGEALILLDSTVHRAELEKARAQLASARAQLQAKQNLFVDSAASVVELENAKLAVAVATADETVAQRNLDACTITAPFDGRVVNVMIGQHEVVQPGQPLVEVVDDSVLRAQFLAPAERMKDLAVGQPVRIRLVETGTAAAGAISHIGAVVDAASSTIKVFAELPNEGGALRGGMHGELTVHARPQP